MITASFSSPAIAARQALASRGAMPALFIVCRWAMARKFLNYHDIKIMVGDDRVPTRG